MTIDDSPSLHTLEILDLLDTLNIKASFFCIGKNIERYPQIFEAIVQRGHQVGGHSYGHKNAWKISRQEFVDDMQQLETLLSSQFYRPPYGKLTWVGFRTLRRLKKNIVFWDIILNDWEYQSAPEVLLQRRMKSARDGSIILLHDNEKSIINVRVMLPLIGKIASQKGIEFDSLH